jgi:hypothetical protein
MNGSSWLTCALVWGLGTKPPMLQANDTARRMPRGTTLVGRKPTALGATPTGGRGPVPTANVATVGWSGPTPTVAGVVKAGKPTPTAVRGGRRCGGPPWGRGLTRREGGGGGVGGGGEGATTTRPGRLATTTRGREAVATRPWRLAAAARGRWWERKLILALYRMETLTLD